MSTIGEEVTPPRGLSVAEVKDEKGQLVRQTFPARVFATGLVLFIRHR